jgi:hypothetical protein
MQNRVGLGLAMNAGAIATIRIGFTGAREGMTEQLK